MSARCWRFRRFPQPTFTRFAIVETGIGWSRVARVKRIDHARRRKLRQPPITFGNGLLPLSPDGGNQVPEWLPLKERRRRSKATHKRRDAASRPDTMALTSGLCSGTRQDQRRVGSR